MIFTTSILSTIPILLIMYALTKTHVINNLIILELISILLILLTFKMLFMLNNETHLAFYFIVMIITESIIGLSIMIATIRTHGNDYLKSSLILKF